MTAAQIVAHLESVIGLNGSPRRVRAIIEDELIRAFATPAAEASELAEARAEAVARIISARQAASEETGTMYSLVLVGTSLDSVAGSCFPLPADTPEVTRIKRQRTTASQILLAIQALNFDQFEQFGSRVLHELGAVRTRVTPRSNDQGIDFYGELNLGQFTQVPAPFLRLAHDVKFTLLGQAKHYPNRAVGPSVVRELVGAVSLARTRTFSRETDDVLDDVAIRPHSPVVALLFTTGLISSGAARLALESGVIARGGEHLAVFLADKGVGMIEMNDHHMFDQNAFLAWLNG